MSTDRPRVALPSSLRLCAASPSRKKFLPGFLGGGRESAQGHRPYPVPTQLPLFVPQSEGCGWPSGGDCAGLDWGLAPPFSRGRSLCRPQAGSPLRPAGPGHLQGGVSDCQETDVVRQQPGTQEGMEQDTVRTESG